MYGCMCTQTCVHRGGSVEVRGLLVGVSSLSSPCWFWEDQAQVIRLSGGGIPLPIKPSYKPMLIDARSPM